MLMPSLQNRLHVKFYLDADLIQFSRRKTIVAGQRQGREPVFAELVLALNVYVLGFVAVEAVKEKAVRSGNVLTVGIPRPHSRIRFIVSQQKILS
ncbi:hypothetical protein SBA4_530030 [Candidatus Sulfopaludibacter sp. SbA4]|nr:hypothetical protein SBA4_530030 [Candidatus Sulfopaludibacter sp. SbA4]